MTFVDSPLRSGLASWLDLQKMVGVYILCWFWALRDPTVFYFCSFAWNSGCLAKWGHRRRPWDITCTERLQGWELKLCSQHTGCRYWKRLFWQSVSSVESRELHAVPESAKSTHSIWRERNHCCFNLLCMCAFKSHLPLTETIADDSVSV